MDNRREHNTYLVNYMLIGYINLTNDIPATFRNEYGILLLMC